MEFSSTEDQMKTNLGLFFDSLKMGDIVLLSADLGMGKTTLVRNFIEYKFEKSTNAPSPHSVQFSSPSYSLIQEYLLPDLKIIHIDLYRLEDEDQVESVGLWDILENKKTIIFIEWAERIDHQDLPKRPTYEIKILEALNSVNTDDLTDEQGIKISDRQYQITRLF